MRTLTKLTFWLSAILCLYSATLAQHINEPLMSPVKFNAKGNIRSPANRGDYPTGTVTVTLAGATTTKSGSYTLYNILTPTQTTNIEVGKLYQLVYSATNITSSNINISPAPGYILSVDGVAKNSMTASGTTKIFSVRIIPAESLTPRPAGSASSITGGQIRWDVALGSVLNGDSAGSLSISGAAISDWSAFFTPATLYYESMSDDVFVYRSGGNIRQIEAPEAFVDVVTLNSTSYQIRLYHPDSRTSSTYPKTVSGLPFVTYTVSQDGSATKLRITKETRTLASPTDTSAPVTRTEFTSIERTGASPAFTWTVHDWTQSGQTSLSRYIHIWTGNGSGGHNEVTQIVAPDNTPASQASTVHTHFAWGDTATNSVIGTTASVATDMVYNTDTANTASYGFVRSSQSTGGAWVAYDYFPTTDEKKIGTVDTIYAPFMNAPSSVSMNPSSGTVTSLTYEPDPFGALRRLKTSETRINGTLVAKSTITYSKYLQDGRYVVLADRQDQINQSGDTLNSFTATYQEDTYDAFFRNQPRAVKKADGTMQSFLHQKGDWDSVTKNFTPNTNGKASRLGTVNGLAENVPGAQLFESYGGFNMYDTYVVPNQSTMELVIRDTYARVARTESFLWDGSAWQLVDWTNFTYNWNNQLVSRVTSNGDTLEAGYSGELKQWERDGAGTKVSYTYDAGSRVKTITKEGVGGRPDLITEFTYDAADRVLTQEVYAASGTTERLTTSRTYDLAGRPLTEQFPGTGVTSYAYDPANRNQTVTTPDLASKTETTYLDGQPYSTTGTAVVARYATYGFESDGRRWTKVNLGTSTSPRWTKQWTDWLGRPVRSESPGFTGQPNLVSTNTYHSTTGQLTKTTRTGMADTLRTYYPYGAPRLSGLDINGNGTLDLAGADRIQGEESFLTYENGAWWQKSRGFTYPNLNNGTEVSLGHTLKRLTGWSGNLRAETRSIDAEGNLTTATTEVDRAAHTITATTLSPGVASPSVSTKVNGLALSSTSSDGLTVTSDYDPLERPLSVTAPRTGTSTTAYYPGTTQPHTMTDAASITVATYGYDIMGRKATVTDAQNHTVRFAYNSRGQMLRTWGDAAMPHAYEYDATYGERTQLHTYQTEYGWDAANWPTAATPSSTTIWTYDSPSGLLKKKTDPANRYVEYDYNANSQLAHRYWARTLPSSSTRVTATYGYDSATGETTSVTYNDGTPSILTTYNRAGRVNTIADATGTRQLTYDTTKPWRRLTEQLPAYFQNRVFTELYDETTNTTGNFTGRSRGFQLGTTGSPAALLSQTSTLNSLGRLAGISSTDSTGTQAFTYAYVANSRLVQSWSALSTGFNTTRSYEAHRNLLTRIDTKWDAASRSRFDYEYDTLARRENAQQQGDAFADYGAPTHQTYGYNARGELNSAHAYLGATGTTTQPLPGRQFDYTYDAAGNRKTGNRTGDPAKAESYTPNALNQITSRTSRPELHVAGTADTDVNIAVDDTAVSRTDRYWHSVLNFDNSAGPSGRLFDISAARPGGTDLATKDFRFGFVFPAAETLTYDDDGNLTSDGRWSYTWDAENRLIGMEAHAGTVFLGGPAQQHLTFTYDYMGRRVAKKVTTYDPGSSQWNPVQETRFLYDGWNLLAETTATGALLRSYTWGLDLTGSLSAAGGVGALLQISDQQTGQRYFPGYDGNGNITTLLSANTGIVAASYEYSPYGETVRMSGAYAMANPIRFSSKYLDTETGLLNYGFRYYDARNGRFINRDPIDERGGLNLYGFCGNDGVNHWDYLGQSWLSKAFKKIGKWVKKNWTSIVGAVLTVINPALGLLWSAGVGYYYGGVKGLAIGAAASYVGGQVAGAFNFGSKLLTNTIAGGIAGGITAGVSGRNIGEGFLAGATSAAVFTAASPVIESVGVQIKNGITQLKNSVSSLWSSATLTNASATNSAGIDPSSKGDIGTYLVRKNAAGDWVLIGKTNGVTTDNAYVNGILGTLGRHAILGGKHLPAGITEYTLFNNPSNGFLADIWESTMDKLGFTTAPAKALADVLNDVQSSGRKVNWVAHSQGGAIFAEAMRYAGSSLSNNTVTFNAGANNHWVTNHIAANAGVQVKGYYYSSWDAVPNILGVNGTPFSMAGSLLASPLLFTENLSPHTAPTSGWRKHF